MYYLWKYVVCVECLIGKQKKPILFKVTEPSSVPYSVMPKGMSISYSTYGIIPSIVAKYCFTALAKRTLLFLTAILAVYCFVPNKIIRKFFPDETCLLGGEKIKEIV